MLRAGESKGKLTGEILALKERIQIAPGPNKMKFQNVFKCQLINRDLKKLALEVKHHGCLQFWTINYILDCGKN